MIQIDEPPNRPMCATCGPVLWMYSARTQKWVAWVSVDRETVRLHRCQHAQDAPVWRLIRTSDPPSEEYRQAREAIGHRTQDRIEEE